MRDAVLAWTKHGYVICHLGMCPLEWDIIGDVFDSSNDPEIAIFNPMIPMRWRYDPLTQIVTKLHNIIDGYIPELDSWVQQYNAYCKRGG
jgi:hypothetical protein